MTELAEAIKKVLDKAPLLPKPPSGRIDYSYAKDFWPIEKAINDAGYEVEAHQGGIGGTLLVLVPR